MLAPGNAPVLVPLAKSWTAVDETPVLPAQFKTVLRMTDGTAPDGATVMQDPAVEVKVALKMENCKLVKPGAARIEPLDAM